MDDGHLFPFLQELTDHLTKKVIKISPQPIVFTHGRVRAGYAAGEHLFGSLPISDRQKGIIHIIGERPCSGHHNFSAYITATSICKWANNGSVDHDITKVVSGISDTALLPYQAAEEVSNIFDDLLIKKV